ncbi:MAG: hypothetical protein ACHQ1H_01050 [Nitrososphaerales archaeon]
MTATQQQEDFSSQISELMTTLDQVKKYKEFARSMGDFTLIILSTIVAILFVYIGFDVYKVLGGQIPANIILSGVEGIIAVVIFGAGFIIATIWVERRVNRVKVGEWKKVIEKDGTAGTMRIVSSLDWPSVFQDIRYSKLGFFFYSALKIVSYWILVSIILLLITGVGLSFLHFNINLAYMEIVSLLLTIALNLKDLQKRYNQAWALDSLLWELRWFDSEFRGKAEFGKGRTPRAEA